MVSCLALMLCFLIGGYVFMSQTKFGTLPEGTRLNMIVQSPHYGDGGFRNTEPLPPMKGNGGIVGALAKYIFSSTEGQRPSHPVPSAKTDLRTLDRNTDVVVWLGHSSYFIQLGGRRILIDPVFSPYASPIFFANRAFDGTNLYTAEEMPDIDYLLISHDHWDHLDYATVTALRPKVRKVVCPLGVGAHFEAWGYGKEMLYEGDWFSALEQDDGFSIHVLPARHFSGRSLTRNKTLWAGFALLTSERRIFFSGDSGYGKHFTEIGARFGGFDLAILDCGQYDDNWRYVHMMPEDTAQAAEDLHARALLPAHVGKFAIAYHTWDDPFKRITEASKGKPYRLLLPLMGEPIRMPMGPGGEQEAFFRWWEKAG